MPASLSEAFRAPTFDTSSYTRSSLESLKNPKFGDNMSYNSHIGGYTQTHNQHSQFQGQGQSGQAGGFNDGIPGYSLSNGSGSVAQSNVPLPRDFVNGLHNPRGLVGSSDNDTLSLMSSINSDRFNDEIEQIKKKYNLQENFSDGSDDSSKEVKCDLHIYHILSCSKCRKKLKKLLLDSDEKEEFTDRNDIEDLPRNLKKSKRRHKRNRDYDSDNDDSPDQSGGLNLDFNYLLRNDNLQNVLVYVVSGILLILLLDFFKRFGR